jgi:endonuclease/exonuclease/phosphatase family metal-dependent hydrolase
MVKILQRRRVMFSVGTAIAVAVGGLSSAALLPSAQATNGGTITVGSYNIHKATPSPEQGVPDWNFRRDRLGLILSESTSDVIALQEVVGWRLPTGPKHRDDVALVASANGFATIQPADNQCVRPRDSYGQLSGPNPCDHSTGIIYKSATTSVMPSAKALASTGMYMHGSIVNTGSVEENKRALTWAYHEKGGQLFFVVNVHANSDKSPAAEAARVVLANNLPSWIEGMNAARGLSIPVFFTGDLNSYKVRQPGGMQAILYGNGYEDPYYTASEKIGARYATVNITPQTRKFFGFPPKPYKYSLKKEPTRIDYVLYKGAVKPLTYETVIRLDPNCSAKAVKRGKCNFDENYRLSDHNMVTAVFAWN